MHAPVIQRTWPERVAMTAVFVANGAAFGTWFGNIPRLQAVAGLSHADLGIVLLCVSLGAIAAMPLAGRYAARIGTARACLLLAGLIAVALPLPVLAPGFPAMLTMALLLGAGLGAMDVCMNAHAAAVERRWGSPVMSSFHAGWSLGEMAGAAAAGGLAAARIGLPGSLAISGAAILLLGLAALRLPEQRDAKPTPFAWPSRTILTLAVIIALGFALEGAVADWSGVYLRTILNVPEGLAASSVMVFAAAMLVMRLVGDALVLRLGPARTIAAGGAVAGLGFVIALSTPTLPGALFGFAIVGVGVANIAPVVFSLAGQRGPAGVSMVATVGYGMLMAGPPLIGFVSEAVGLRLALALLLLAAAAMLVLGRRLGRVE